MARVSSGAPCVFLQDAIVEEHKKSVREYVEEVFTRSRKLEEEEGENSQERQSLKQLTEDIERRLKEDLSGVKRSKKEQL